MSISILVVFAIATLAIILFVTELVRPDVTALIVLLALAFLEPWTHISPMEAISGFSNPATITVLAMLILSEAIRQTGAVQLLSQRLARFAGDNETKQLAVTIGVPGVLSGFVNNTPVVALLVPVISDMAHRGKTSPSKLLIPLSYASMFGGTLTLIGTSTNLLASDVSGRLLGHEFGMFEFTGLGLIVLAVGSLFVLWLFYIMTGLITEVISNNASVLLLLPVAVETAELIDANPFAFVLVVTFAASMCFLGPIGYQTNLFVYGPGGYKIIDYIRVGAPLQLILSIVTVAGIYTFWGI